MTTHSYSDVDLPPLKRALAAAMRRAPVGVRKFSWWWTKAYAKLGGGGFAEDPAVDRCWPAGLQRPVRGANHPYVMRLNLQDWMERRAYFSGALYQRDLEEVLMMVLRPADQFLDVGANIGLITLLGAALVGPRGTVVACEANPEVCDRARMHVALNGLARRVQLLQIALGSEEGSATLSFRGSHSGVGTLTAEGNGGIEVRVARGDDVLPAFDRSRPLVIKLDVEGYEQRVLEGMARTLAHPNCALVVEVTDFMLKRVGDSAETLYELLHGHGFVGYVWNVESGRFRRVLSFSRSAAPLLVEQYDALFVKPGSEVERRIAHSVDASARSGRA